MLRRHRLGYWLCCISLAMLLPVVVVGKEVVRAVFMEDFPPLSFTDRQKANGMLVEQVEYLVEQSLGMQLEVKTYPWKRAQRLVEAGEADIFYTVETEARRQYAWFVKRPMYRIQLALLASAHNKRLDEIEQIRHLQDLEGFSITSYRGDGWSAQNLQQFPLLWMNGAQDALRAVDRGLADICIGNIPTLTAQLRTYGGRDRFVMVPLPDLTPTRPEFRIGVSQRALGASQLLEDLNRALEKAEVQQKLREIEERWHEK
ncbi:polar amino acid transport system substrate-binding protein [Chitinivorax tropicus]|uniref:Polar amino acid transport system substrate-binding protein n=1 Tax=Chitinivorax tropicus TaxID=714531 RepID=A0A840MSZ7_9PROT|nr:transporter substrate-binding domain-containing protein [Chitinivorax tropicus]MBB5019526.1 polar amino acid transport system substrate-binding protein [Chitinivorax tropicus]